MASVPRALFRPARQALSRRLVSKSNNTSRILYRSMAMTPGNEPPMEPQKARRRDMDVGELEGAMFTISPLRRVGEDDKTMRARLVYQSRKRGILETDLLLSTFADEYLPTMARAQMAEYDLFLDENDWDIYYWATQEEPASASDTTTTTTATSTSSSSPVSADTTTDTSAASYGSSAEAISAEATSTSSSSSNTTTTKNSSASPGIEATSTGGVPLTGSHTDAKAATTSPSPSTTTTDPIGIEVSGAGSSGGGGPQPYAGEWAQTVGTFKPAYRPVPARWRDSEVLALLRAHVRARKGEQGGGMAFMPALRS
ncbi:Flavinator of succinate dehydrogenase-domain-containing protein [Nemania sp. FL0916]|nr:Flavinator of succinate dehydrogenase-domain-containing protein [Nemania sp. FL0916]